MLWRTAARRCTVAAYSREESFAVGDVCGLSCAGPIALRRWCARRRRCGAWRRTLARRRVARRVATRLVRVAPLAKRHRRPGRGGGAGGAAVDASRTRRVARGRRRRRRLATSARRNLPICQPWAGRRGEAGHARLCRRVERRHCHEGSSMGGRDSSMGGHVSSMGGQDSFIGGQGSSMRGHGSSIGLVSHSPSPRKLEMRARRETCQRAALSSRCSK